MAVRRIGSGSMSKVDLLKPGQTGMLEVVIADVRGNNRDETCCRLSPWLIGR